MSQETWREKSAAVRRWWWPLANIWHGTDGRTTRDLIEHECFGYLLAAHANWGFILDGEMKWFPVRGRLQANHGEALLDAAIRGLGITLAPTFIAEHALRERQLEILLRKFPLPALGIYAIFPGNRYVPHRVRVLVDYIAEHIGSAPAWDRVLK